MTIRPDYLPWLDGASDERLDATGRPPEPLPASPLCRCGHGTKRLHDSDGCCVRDCSCLAADPVDELDPNLGPLADD